MALRFCGYIDLPGNEGEGGFDHADIHVASDRLYVAHTSNHALDVIDCARERYVESVPGLTAVAGALVSRPAASYSPPIGARTQFPCSGPAPNGRRSRSRSA